ncbi:ribonuclease III [Candidatus Gracilibacteria bacterium]|nr:ribonuclease III [Candidatus Gracilibacteria bacterium]
MSRISIRFARPEFESQVSQLLASLQILPKNPDLYTLACVHRSVLNEVTDGYSESNERLEYLGDAVLELVITEALFHEFPAKPEGELTDIRSALVRGRNLAQIAHRLHFAHAIQVSRGEYNARGHENPYILANTLEAIIGALYLDHGFERASEFILQHVYSTLPHILEQSLFIDPKSALQELTQEVWGITPIYQVIEEIGADHNKVYLISVSLHSVELGQGRGSSKKKGEQDAAENALGKKGEWESKIKGNRV